MAINLKQVDKDKRAYINCLHRELGIPKSYIKENWMPIYAEPDETVSIGRDIFGRAQKLIPEAAKRWFTMERAARSDNISLLIVSAFRSIDYQASLIRAKLDKGQSIDEILKINSAPGYSEHHSGRALDLTTDDCEPLLETFDETDAFEWLKENAYKYGFTMSYPKNNKLGISYEPWHWFYGRA